MFLQWSSAPVNCGPEGKPATHRGSMLILKIILAIATAYAIIWTLYLLVFPLAASLWRRRGRASQRQPSQAGTITAIFVPAWNAARVIAPCVDALRACPSPTEHMTIYVLADHCTDDTAA